MDLFISKRNIIIAAIVAALLLGAVLYSVIINSENKARAEGGPVFISEDNENNSIGLKIETDKIYVHVTGAVKNPDVYALNAGNRIFDAIEAAGGITEDGYKDAHNLAAHIEDGMKIYVPTTKEWEKDSSDEMPELIQNDNSDKYVSAPNNNVSSDKSKQTTSKEYTQNGPKPLPSGKVSVNNGSLEELTTLPGVGETLGNNIIQYRKEHGKFENLDELLNVPKIGEKTYEKLLPYIKL